jgi:hypothetical protein
VVVSVNTVPGNRELLPTRLLLFCKTCSHPFLQRLPRPIKWSHSVQIFGLKFSSNFSSRCVILFSMLVTSYQVHIFSSSFSDSLEWNTKWHTHTKPQKSSLPCSLHVLPFLYVQETKKMFTEWWQAVPRFNWMNTKRQRKGDAEKVFSLVPAASS